MAQANQNIQNLTFPAVRAQITDNLEALYLHKVLDHQHRPNKGCIPAVG